MIEYNSEENKFVLEHEHEIFWRIEDSVHAYLYMDINPCVDENIQGSFLSQSATITEKRNKAKKVLDRIKKGFLDEGEEKLKEALKIK